MRGGRIAVIIVAAGYSSRMNCFKPLLKFEDRTAVERLIDTYRCAGVQDIYIVVGYNGQEVMNLLAESKATCVLNESYADGMFTSVRKGIQALDKHIDAFFMQPVDIPLIKAKTLDFLKEKYYKCNKGVLYPTFNEVKGHPPLIDCKYNTLITGSRDEGGLKRILENLEQDAICVPVPDKAILMDMDKKADYEKLLAYDHLNAPDREECLAIIKYYKVPDPIVRHCAAVERVVHILCCELSSYDISLDCHALSAAALLHDMARDQKNHAGVGAGIIKSLGYDFVGDIIATHMDIDVRPEELISEKEILYLADKLVMEEKICNMEERFKQALKDKGDSPQAVKNIGKRWQSAKDIILKFERITGKGFLYDKTNLSDSAWKDLYRG